MLKDNSMMANIMGKKFKREINSLDQVFEFVNNFVRSKRIDESILFSLSLVVEEIFTNMVKYNSQSNEDILISLKKLESRLIVTLTDFDAEPFDITKTKEVDVRQPLENRKVGGLGIHLVKRMVDKLSYEHKGRESKVTLIKYLEN